MSSTGNLPDIAEVLAPILGRVAREQRPLLIAIAERLAADRYRGWAEATEDPTDRAELLACASREEDIASRVEALHEKAKAIQADILAKHTDLVELNRTLFDGRPVEDQYRIQAQGERVGASTWRSFAERAEPAARETYLDCAELEVRSAEVLESILGRTR